MAVRPIDANEFMKRLTLDTGKGFYGEFMDGSDTAFTSREIGRFVDEMPTLTPPNEPLSIEQLREMDGEPVWITRIADLDVCDDGWAIPTCEIANKRPIMDLLDMQFELHIWWPGREEPDVPELENYGKTWLAYRYNPERMTAHE